MSAEHMIGIYMVIDETLRALGHTSHRLAGVSDAEELTPIHELTVGLPDGAWVYGDKGYNSAPDEAVIRASDGGVLVPRHTDNMTPNTWAAQCGLRTFRRAIETVNSQLTAMGINRLHVRSVAGLEIKVHASLLALARLNLG